MTNPLWRGAAVAVLALALGACSHSTATAPALPEVTTVTAHASDLPLTRGYPGRLAATQTAEVRARITGIVLQRVYKEGSDVKAGEVLFRIDPAPLQASLRAAEGQLAQAQASARNAALNATRSQQLGAKGVLSKQDVDNAVATAAEAAAAAKAAQANVENARINLGYATVTAPISGRAGRANVTQGALVSPTDANPLTTVQVIDPIYANFSEPMADVEALRKQEQAGAVQRAGRASVRLTLPDGSTYARAGSLDFTDLAVDPATGAVDLRAAIPNPDHALMPGMFVKVALDFGSLRGAFALPQAAIQRDNDGAYVLVVGDGDKVVEKRVQLGQQRGGDWIVTSGITAGDRVVVSGVQDATPGTTVRVAADSASPSTSATTD